MVFKSMWMQYSGWIAYKLHGKKKKNNNGGGCCLNRKKTY